MLFGLYTYLAPESFYAPYIAMLPSEEELGHLMFYTNEELALLQCYDQQRCPMLERVNKQKDNIRGMYSRLANVFDGVFPKGAYTHRRFMW